MKQWSFDARNQKHAWSLLPEEVYERARKEHCYFNGRAQ
jgi:hypothetical protein